MRLIIIGTEYTGKTTLVDALMAWGNSKGIHFHWDDHFSIPDQYFLNEADQQVMLNLPPVLKERFQRFQIYYHIHVAKEYEDCLLPGFYIEEMIYGHYYYPGHEWTPYARKVESELPADSILLLLTAAPDVIRRRMELAPHKYPIVKPADVEAISKQFETEYNQSWITNKLRIDTSDLTPDGLFDTFMKRVVPHLSARDLLRWQATK